MLTALLTTPALAQALSIGFDKPSYLIEPNKSQRINIQLRDSSGNVVKAEETTDIHVTFESPTASVSAKLSEPYEFKSSANIVISKGTTQRGIIYRDPMLGTSSLFATGSARVSKVVLVPGVLKITIGYPPPPPPPAPKPAIKPSKAAPINSVFAQVTPEQTVQIEPEPSSEVTLEVLSIDDILGNFQAEPEVLPADIASPFSLLWEIINYLRGLLFDKIML